MAMYRTKERIEAEKYEKGMEDGFTCIPLVGMCKWQDASGNYKNCEKCLMELPKVPYINSITGMQYINEGDYIVKSEIGVKWVATKEEFEQKYEEIIEG